MLCCKAIRAALESSLLQASGLSLTYETYLYMQTVSLKRKLCPEVAQIILLTRQPILDVKGLIEAAPQSIFDFPSHDLSP